MGSVAKQDPRGILFFCQKIVTRLEGKENRRGKREELEKEGCLTGEGGVSNCLRLPMGGKKGGQKKRH